MGRLMRLLGWMALVVISGQALAGTITASPGTCANVDRGSSYPAWTNPANARSSDDAYATTSVNDNAISDYLRCTGFNFAVPSGATITGFTVSIERRASDTLVRDETVRLVKALSVTGTNKAATAADYPTGTTAADDAVAIYGTYNDLWGSTWTPGDVNNTGFGVALAVIKDGKTGGARTAYVDHILVTVHYTSACDRSSSIPSDVSVTCYCDDFNRTSLDNSPFFGANWITSISDTTNIQPGIVTPGFLRLTNNTASNAKAATIPAAFPAAGNYISVEFDYFSYDGSNADGIALTLSDYTKPPQPGAFGGSLGFAQKGYGVSDCTTTGGCPGFAGGWLGVGIDEYGNYQNATEGRCGGAAASGTVPMIGVRGSGDKQTGYCWLGGSGSVTNIAAGSSKTRGPGHRYQVVVDARTAAASHTYVKVSRDTSGTGAYTTLVNSFDAFAQGYTQAAVPANWQISFTGSTGGAINIHEIGNLKVCAQNVVPPSGGTANDFNAIDEAYGASPVVQNFLTGHIYMKLVGTPFKLNVAALSNNQIQTGYVLSGSKTVTVKLVNQGNPTDSDYCDINATCSTSCKNKSAVTDGTQTLTFLPADGGKKQTADFTLNTAYKSLVAIISDSAVSACSTDAFAVRPQSFQPVTTTATNVGTSGLPRFKAGSDKFDMTVITNGIVGSPSGYAGTPKINNAAVTPVAPATVAGQISGTFGQATTGITSSTATGNLFTYSEVGAFSLAAQGVYEGVLSTECGPAGCDGLKTGSWTGVDSISTKADCVDDSFSNDKDANGKYGCLFGTSGPTSLGRFIPDHFALADGSVVMPACGGLTGFTYMNQPFDQVKFTLEAQNGAGTRTQNYTGTPATGVPVVIVENNNNGTNLVARVSGVPAGTWSTGTYSVDTDAAMILRDVAPDGPFDTLQLGIQISSEGGNVMLANMNMRPDTTGTCTTSTSASTDCTARRLNDAAGVAQPTIVRFGRLRMMNAHGSERLNLPIPLTAQYWNGSYFVTNTLDNCTSITASNIGFMAYNGNVTSSNMNVSNIVLGGGGQFTNGVGSLRLTSPGQAGSVDLCIDLGADTPITPAWCTATSAGMPWLQGKWVNTSYIDDPKVRASFGIYKNVNEFIYLREMY